MVDYMTSVVMTQTGFYSTKASKEKEEGNVPIKLYLEKRATGQI